MYRDYHTAVHRAGEINTDDQEAMTADIRGHVRPAHAGPRCLSQNEADELFLRYHIFI